jgi:hypothetical protein
LRHGFSAFRTTIRTTATTVIVPVALRITPQLWLVVPGSPLCPAGFRWRPLDTAELTRARALSAPLRQKCTCRIDEVASGRHLCGLHFSVQSCRSGLMCSMNGRASLRRVQHRPRREALTPRRTQLPGIGSLRRTPAPAGN